MSLLSGGLLVLSIVCLVWSAVCYLDSKKASWHWNTIFMHQKGIPKDGFPCALMRLSFKLFAAGVFFLVLFLVTYLVQRN